TKDLLDALTLVLTHRVASVASRASIQAGSLAPVDHGDVRCDVAPAKISHEVFAVVALVRAERAGSNGFASLAIAHRLGILGLRTQRRSDLQSEAQAMAVLHERMAAIAELRFLALAFAHELGIGVGSRLVLGVGAPFAADVAHALGIRPTPVWRPVLAAQ